VTALDCNSIAIPLQFHGAIAPYVIVGGDEDSGGNMRMAKKLTATCFDRVRVHPASPKS
jgi:hypothetical protein